MINLPPPSTRTVHKAFVLTASVIVLGLITWAVEQHVSIEVLVVQEDRLRAAIVRHPWAYFAAGFGIYTALALVPGTGGKAIVVGWLFGYWQAMMIVMVGLTAAAMLIFSLSRYLFREHIERRYTRFVSLMNRHIEREGAFYLLTLRMAHAPYSIVNPVSGASRVPSWTFFWTTLVGLLPGTAVWVYVGGRLPSLADLAHSGPVSFLDPLLIAALVASASLPLLFRTFVSRVGIPFTGGTERAADAPDTPRQKP